MAWNLPLERRHFSVTVLSMTWLKMSENLMGPLGSNINTLMYIFIFLFLFIFSSEAAGNKNWCEHEII